MTIPQKMTAAALEKFGGPEVMGIRTVPLPKPDEDEILIRVQVAGVGVWDHYEREGEMASMMPVAPSFPYVPGSDGAGEVVAVGGLVHRFDVGDLVYGCGFLNPKGGFYAEYAAVKEDMAAKLPKGLSIEQAAALASDGVTGLQGLTDQLDVKSGESLLIFGASGGIGHLAVQLARRLGARVLAAASGEDGVALAKRVGAEAVVEGHSLAAVEAACRAFAPEGLDAALVLAGGEVAQGAVKLVRPGGRVAFPNGVEPPPEVPSGIRALPYDGVPGRGILDRLNALVEVGPFHLEIGRRYRLEQAAQAQQDVLRHHLGKFVLAIH